MLYFITAVFAKCFNNILGATAIYLITPVTQLFIKVPARTSILTPIYLAQQSASYCLGK